MTDIRDTLEKPEFGAVLSVRDLQVTLNPGHGNLHAIRGLSLDLYQGEFLAVVGESGSGKSVSFLSILGLLSRMVPSTITGKVLFHGADLTTLSPEALRRLRGKELSLIFQDPLSALNPVIRIGDQITDVIMAHEPKISRSDAWRRAVETLELVRIPNAAQRASDYPYQFSGGMRQRVLIAMAIACRPKVLIADEPTTALDVTIQAQILELLDQLRRELSMSMILITHDLGVVARHADRVVVMYAGRVVEEANVRTLFARPTHPYTTALLRAVPKITSKRGNALSAIAGEPPSIANTSSGCDFASRCERMQGRQICLWSRPPLIDVAGAGCSACHFADEGLEARSASTAIDRASVGSTQAEPVAEKCTTPLLRVDGISKRFPVHGRGLKRGAVVHAVDDVSFEIRRGETLGVVGESGSGKSTMARLVLRLLESSGGRVVLEGEDITHLSHNALRKARSRMQVMFQDSRSAFNPRMTVEAIVGEPLVIAGLWGKDGRERVQAIMRRVGLRPEFAQKYPHEFSGGQQQRIGMARALVLNPSLLVLDEPTASLDVSIRAQIVNLLKDLQRDLKLSYLFIAHDLSVVHHISDRIAVMYLGRIVEIGDAEALCRTPMHPYTRALLRSIPDPDPELRAPEHEAARLGAPPDPINPPSGCPFHPRCDLAMELGKRMEDSVQVGDRRVPRTCVENRPKLVARRANGSAACHFPLYAS